MAGPSLKKVAQAMAYECLSGFEIDEAIPNVGAEAGPAEKTETGYGFDMIYTRQRGTPKAYRVEVSEIA